MKLRLLILGRLLMPAILALGPVLLLGGCQDGLSDTVVVSGIHTRGPRLSTGLTVETMDDPAVTKSSFAGGESAEVLVDSWNLLIFEAGILKAKYYQASAAAITGIEIVGGRPYDYYALANVGDLSSDPRFTVGSTTESYMDGWTPNLRVEGESFLPMAWKQTGVSYTLQQLKDGAVLDISLKRLVARYDFVVDKSRLSKYTVTVTGATLEGPSSMTPFAVKSRSYSTATTTDRATASDVARLDGGQKVTFYPLENCYGDLLPSNTNPWSKKPRNIAEGSHPTYVEITGTARLRDGSTFDIPVTYRFYLGQDDTSNFDVIRNTVNTVTLIMTDEAVDLPDNPSNPLWKIEKGSFTDDRSLAFEDEAVSLATDNSTYYETIHRFPQGLNYTISWDTSLDDAGLTVYEYDSSSGTVGTRLYSGDVTTTGAVRLGCGTVAVSRRGNMHISTTDGRFTDDLSVTIGRIPVRIDALVGKYVNDPSSVRYHSSIDTVGYNGNDGFPLCFDYRVVYSDGSETSISSDAWNDLCRYDPTGSYVPQYIKNISLTQNYTGNKYIGRLFRVGYSSAYWFYPKGTFFFTTYYDGIAVYDVVYEEGGVEVSFHNRITHLSGRIVPTRTEAGVNPGEVLSLGYQFVYGNEAQGSFADYDPVDVTDLVTRFEAGYESCLNYLGCSSGAHHFRASDYGSVSVTPASRQIHLRDIEPRVAYHESYGFPNVSGTAVTVVDSRELDHLELNPAELYAPEAFGYGNGSTPYDGSLNFKLYAYYTDGTFSDISGDASVVWTLSPFYYLKYSDQGLSQIDNLSATPDGAFTRIGYRGSYYYSTFGGTGNYLGVLPDPSSWNPATFAEASYTLRGVTRTASALVSLEKNVNLVSVEVTPASQTTYADGGVASFTARANFDDGSYLDITETGTWTCDVYLENNGRGRFTAGSLTGNTTVQVGYTHRGVTMYGTAAVTIVKRNAQTIELQYYNGRNWVTGTQYVNLDSDQSYRLLVSYDMGDPAYVTSGFVLSSSNPSVLTVNGTATHAAAVGSSDVTAAYSGLTSNTLTFNVRNHSYSYEVDITPYTRTIECDGTAEYSAWFVRKDNGEEVGRTDITSSATWSLGPEFSGIASISAGVVTADNRTGSDISGTVTASYSSAAGYMYDFASLTVKKPFVPSLSASPSSLQWDWFQGGSPKTFSVSSNLAWTIAPVDGFTISPMSGTGNATVTVAPAADNTSGSVLSGTLTVSASAYPLTASVSLDQGYRGGRPYFFWWVSYEISPSNASVYVGGTTQFTAKAKVYSNSSRTNLQCTLDITDSSTWSTGDNGVATVRRGTASGVSAGTTTVTFRDFWEAAYQGTDYSSATASLTVTPPVYKLVTTVTRSTIGVGESTTASATLYKSVDAGAHWDSQGAVSGGFTARTGASYVSVSGSTVTGSSPGTATIRSTYSGHTISEYEDAEVTVTGAPTTYRLVVSPSSATISCNGTKSFTATLQTYVGGTLSASRDVTSSASWQSSNTSAATVTAGVATGCNTTISSLTTTISAEYDGTSSGASGNSATLTVEGRAPAVQRIEFNRSHYELTGTSGGSVYNGTSFSVTAYYEGGSSATVTADCSYSDQGSVSVDSSSGKLTATAECSGKTITASLGGCTATATYSAAEKLYPTGLTSFRFEAQGGSQREFIIESLEASVKAVISGAVSTEDVIGDVTYSISGPISGGGYQGGRGRIFQFNSTGSGSVTFTYTLNGVSVSRTINFRCNDSNEITARWSN